MKIKSYLVKIAGVSLLSVSSFANAASNPASQEWVLQQIASALSNVQGTITAQDWASICNKGSPNNASGCYGNVSSSAFTKLSNALGGYTTLANINPSN